MCPLFPLHLVLVFAGVFVPLWLASSALAVAAATAAEPWGVQFDPTALLELQINEQRVVRVSAAQPPPGDTPVPASDDDNIAQPSALYDMQVHPSGGNWTARFNVTGHFIGYAKIRLLSEGKESDTLRVTVIREKGKVLDIVFVASVASLVSIIYINFGCALDWGLVTQMLRRPVGPAIGFAAQFVFMPLCAFGLGKLLFPDNAPMQLGLFFTGVSPAGGASNIWTVALGGNLNLSITMTAISTFAAFLMMPFWIFTLGSGIFAMGDIEIPYRSIASSAVGLIVPLGIGLLIQRFLPRVSRFMVRILKPFSAFLIVFIVVFAIIANLYLFQLFSWRIVVAGLGLPWLGFVFGWIAAWACKQAPNDKLAIAVETGIQNTGIAIFLLSALGQPEGDLTTVVPVSVAIMTPFPLMALFAYRKLRGVGGGKGVEGPVKLQETGSDDFVSTAGAGDHADASATDPLSNGHVRKY